MNFLKSGAVPYGKAENTLLSPLQQGQPFLLRIDTTNHHFYLVFLIEQFELFLK